MDSLILVILPTLIVSLWMMFLLNFVRQVRDELKFTNDLLSQIAFISPSEVDEITDDEGGSHWCPRCKDYYSPAGENKGCPNCGLIGHVA